MFNIYVLCSITSFFLLHKGQTRSIKRINKFGVMLCPIYIQVISDVLKHAFVPVLGGSQNIRKPAPCTHSQEDLNIGPVVTVQSTTASRITGISWRPVLNELFVWSVCNTI